MQTVYLVRNDNGIEHWEMVITDEGEIWYENAHDIIQIDSSITTQGYRGAYLTGSRIDNVAPWWRWWDPTYTVVFYLPTCFWEMSPGRFDGIIDAWASNGGGCPYAAWDGAGYNGWWNFHTCASNRSSKVAKIVQARLYLYHSRNLNESQATIARRVTCLVTW